MKSKHKNNTPFIIPAAILVASLILAFTWYNIEANKQEQATVRAKLQQQEKASSQAKENLNNNLFQSCLDKATDAYPWANLEKDVQRDPTNSKAYSDYFYKSKDEAEKSCKLRYGS